MKNAVTVCLLSFAFCAIPCQADTNGVPGFVLEPNTSGSRQQALATVSTNFSAANLKQLGHMVLKSPTPVGPPEEIEVQANGAVAQFAPHKAFFAPNPNTLEAVRLAIPDHSREIVLKSHVVGIGYWDSITGETVLFATPQNCIGEVSGSTVRYTNALDGTDAEITYTYTRDTFDQTVILRKKLPEPAALNMKGDPGNIRLVVITEFVDPPEPIRVPNTIDLSAKNQLFGIRSEDSIPDETLFFGSMRMAAGKMLLLGDSSVEVPSGKTFLEINGSHYLVEFCPWLLVKALVDSLPTGTLHAKVKARGELKSLIGQMPKPRSVGSNKQMVLAKPRSPGLAFNESTHSKPGVVLDYLLVSTHLIDVDLSGGSPPYKQGPAAVGQYTNDFWISWPSSFSSLANLTWSDQSGGGSGVGLVVSNAPGGWGNGSSDIMYGSYLYGSPGGTVTLTLTNLPNDVYNFYLYGHEQGANANASFKLFRGGQQIAYKGTTLWDNGLWENAWNSTNWEPGVQYQVFKNIAVTNQTILIQIPPGGNTYPYISGLQIVESAAVPTLYNSNILINVNFGNSASNKVGFAAVGLGTNDYWNGYYNPYNPSGAIIGLTNANGFALSAGLTVLNAAGVGSWTVGDSMYGSFSYATNGGNVTLLITNLPGGGTYDFYLYGHGSTNDANSVFQLWSGGRDWDVRGTTIWGSGYSNSVAWDESQQYIVFHDVPVYTNQTVTIVAGHDPYGFANLNGMQIVFKGSSDTNLDGLPDVWKWYYFGNTSTTGATDYDGDHLSNFREFQLGIDPTKSDTDGNGVADGNDSERVWVEDGTPARGLENDASAASPSWSGASTENWNWSSYWGAGWGGNGVGAYSSYPYSSCQCLFHVSDTSSGIHQHWFDKSVVNMMANTGEVLITYVNIDPSSVPSEIMLQWYTTETNGLDSWEHRAYWGSNAISWGTNGTASRWYVTNLPTAGSWARLEVPASAVGLEGKVIQGMAFTLYNGRAAFDHAGKFIPDMDGNGLTDSWEKFYFTSIGQDPNGDPDHDGLSNLDELRLGTNPTNCNPPQISGQPQNTCGYPGGSAYFMVTPSGSVLTDYHFQWRVGGTNIASATNSTLVIASVQSTNLGNYSVVITNACGSITSSVATLTFCPPPFVQITVPTNNSTFTAPALVTIQATATNSDSSVTNVQFYRGNLFLLGNDATAPYSYTWSAAAGSYSLTAVAYDSHGLISTSSPVSITVGSACYYTNNTFSSNNAFGNGFLMNLNYSNSFGRLQLNSQATPFDFISIACNTSGTVQGTLVRVNTRTGQPVGEYNTAPTNKASFPGHVAVDRYGNTWVANWKERGYQDGSGLGSITKIGIVIGGTRWEKMGDGSFVQTNNGHYLKPPFTYCTAIDRDGDGYIKTSTGAGDVLGWTTNSVGGVVGSVLNAEDECIINYVRVPAQLASTLAVDANNDVWVGGYCADSILDGNPDPCGNRLHVKLNGITGQVFTNTEVIFTNAGTAYGGFEGIIGQNGFLWSSGGANDVPGNRSLVVFDPVNQTNLIMVGTTNGNYGMDIDPLNGNVWVATYDASNVVVYSKTGARLTNYAHGDTYGSGIAIDNNSNVWVSHGPFNGAINLARMRTDGSSLTLFSLQTNTCPGVTPAREVCFDSAGKVWTLCASSPHVLRVNPTTGQVEVCLQLGSGHQARGDLTGYKLLQSIAPSGIWSVIYTNGATNQAWGTLTWTASTTDTNQIRVEVRAANTYGQLSTNSFQLAYDSVPLTNVIGQLLEIRVTLIKLAAASASPWLHDLTVDCAHQTNHAPLVWAGTNQTISLPQTQALLLDGAVSDPDGPLGPYISWSKISGTGTVTFQPAGTGDPADIKAWFGAAGDYTLQLSASDSQLSASSNVLIHVTATNVGPSVNAGPDQTNALPDYVYLPGTASDDGLPVGSALTVWWTNMSAGTVTFDDLHSPATMAGFAAPGTYVLRLTATDGSITNFDETTITVLTNSPVNYLKNVAVASAGLGGLRATNQGVLHLTGINGTVTKAYLYWHGPTDSTDPKANEQILLNGRFLTGKNIGVSNPDFWRYYGGHPYANSQAYRADVTGLVKALGNGDYVLGHFSDSTKLEEIEINGASLVVFFDPVISSNRQDVAIWQGNLGNFPTGFEGGGSPVAIALQPNGKILVGGWISWLGTEPRSGIGRFLPNGFVDEAFNPEVGDGGGIYTITLQSDGKIIIGGSFSLLDNLGRTNVARLNTDGSLDTSFDPGTGADNAVNCSILRSDGKIFIAGTFTNFNASSSHKVALLTSSGSFDSSFASPLGLEGIVNCMALDANGKLVLGGDFRLAGPNSVNVVRLNTDGSLDTSFAAGTNYNGAVYSLAIDANGKIVVGGIFYDINGDSWNRLVKLNTDGTIDTSFNRGDGLNNTVLAVAIQDGTNILIGGAFNHFNGHDCGYIARLKPNGDFDTSFDPNGGSASTVSLILQEPDGTLLLPDNGGTFDGKPCRPIAHLDHNGNLIRELLDPEWHVELPGITYTNGPASLQLHVADGEYYSYSPVDPVFDQPAADPSLYINGANWWNPSSTPTCSKPDDIQLFAGYSVPLATTLTGDGAHLCGYGLWDIRETNINSFLSSSTSPQTIKLDSVGSYDDYLSLIVALAKLPPGSAPNPPAVPVPTNLPPLVHSDTFTVHHGTLEKVLDVLNNDTSPTSTLLSIASVSTPSHGNTEILYEQSAILYTPQPGFVGADSFSYTAIDAYGNMGTATVTVNVDGPEPLPIVCGQTLSATLGQSGAKTAFRGSGQPADFYRVQGTLDNYLQISVSTEDFHFHVYLRDPSGELVASAAHTGSSITYLCPLSGTYTIEVTSHSLRESGSYTLNINGGAGCAPQANMQVWADGILIPPGGVIDFGIDSNKTVTVLNAGTANGNPDGLLGSSTSPPFTISPDWLARPFPPGATEQFSLTVDQSHAGPTNGSVYIAGVTYQLTAFIPASGNRPLISITNPLPGSVVYAPANVTLVATGAAQVVGATITNVQFFATTAAGRSNIGYTAISPYTLVWQNPPIGTYLLSAWAYDSGGRVGASALVPVTLAHRPPNHPPVASNDYVNVFINTPTNVLTVLTNDYDPDGDPLRITSVTAQNGTATIAADAQSILYQPLTNSYGDDILIYTISDGRNGTASAKVYVTTIQTTIQIIDPPDYFQTNINAQVGITAVASTSDGAIGRVEFYANNQKFAEAWNPPYTVTFTNTGAGLFYIKAVALDTRGFIVPSDPVHIRFSNNNDVPIADISNLTEGQVIRDGSFDLFGTASNVDVTANVGYHIRLYRPDDGVTSAQNRLVADFTPATTGRKANELLGHLDFSMVRNGGYVLELEVDNVDTMSSVSVLVGLVLENNVKIGQFTFSEQDLVVPVSGIPLTVTRTYNSINPNQGDFGQSWTYGINDVEMELDEDRTQYPDYLDHNFNMRVGGGRDVTLTMPGGKRTTFNFYWTQGSCNQGDGVAFCLFANWRAPYGINAKLTALDDNRLVAFWGGNQWWQANSEAGVDNFDFSGFVLQTVDGTGYIIKRPQTGLHTYLLDSVSHSVTTYGKGVLTTITNRAGDRIELTSSNILHYNATNLLTRSLVIERTNNNLISAIRDPRTLTGRPALKYEYDGNLNLSAVYKLVNTNPAVSDTVAYVKTTYHYTNVNYPHFLTSIDDPRGVTAARSIYDSNGRLIQMTDAAGYTTTFDHDVDGRREVITDPLTNRTTHVYDERGNVTQTIDALSHSTWQTYDLNNNVLTEKDELGHTTTNTYDGRGLRTSTIDPLGHTNSVVYDDHAQVTSMTDARANSTTNLYDTSGHPTVTIQTLAGRSIVSTSQYDPNTGQLTASVDPVTNRTEYGYDSVGNMTAATSKDSQGNALSQTVYAEPGTLASGYDANGNRLVQFTTRTLPGGTIETNVTRYQYDGQSRVIKTILPLNSGSSDDYTIQIAYNSIGKPATNIDMFGRATVPFYDARGSVVQTLYPDGTISRTLYDQLGRAVVNSDHMLPPLSGNTTTNNGSRTVYDEVGRAIRTERLKDIVLTVSSSGGSDPVYTCTIADPPPTVIAVSSTEYDPANRVSSTTDENAHTTSYGYNNANQRTSIQDALGNVTTYTYDENGNQKTFRDALGNSTTNVYDDLNRRVAVQHPLVSSESIAITTIVYDDAGRRVAESDLGGVTNAYAYDALGRLIAVTNAWGTSDQIVTWYTNDEVGNLIAQKDAEGRVTKFEFDKMGRRTKRTLPDVAGSPTLFETTTYDIVTNNSIKVLRKTVTDFNGNAVQYVHDAMDRLERKIIGTSLTSSPVVSFSYTPAGQRATMIDPSGETDYGYDDFDRLNSKSNWIGTLQYSSDAKGNVWRMLLPSGGGYAASYNYDELDRLSKVYPTDQGQGIPVTVYKYDPIGNLASVRSGADATYYPLMETAYQYDSRNRLTNMVERYITQPSGGVYATNALATFYYNPSDRPLHPTGNRMAARETIYASTTINRAVNYYYDNLYRLTKEDITSTPSGTIDYSTHGAYLGYDKVGNRRSREVIGTIGGGVTTFNTQGFDARDRLTGTGNSFDNNGNTLRGSVTPAQTTDDQYDFENRLISRHATINSQPTTITMVYDGDGNRVQKTLVTSSSTNTIFYEIDDRNPSGYAQVIGECYTNGGSLYLTNSYLYGHSLIRETLSPNSAPVTYWYGYDGHGNVRFLLDSNGAITNTYNYDAFGILIASTGSAPNKYLYCGEQFDSDLGLYYNRARYLNVTAGRFWTVDSFEGTQEEPMSLHKYLYAQANPVLRNDPNGNTGSIIEFGVSSTIAIGTRGAYESARAPTYVQAISAALWLSLGWSIDATIESYIFNRVVDVRAYLQQAKSIWQKRNPGKALPKIVPMPASVIPAVALHVALHEAAVPPDAVLTRAPSWLGVIHRSLTLAGYGSAGRNSAGQKLSWDEYPFASTFEGGRPSTGPVPVPGFCSVYPVPLRENILQGVIISASYSLEKISVGNKFEVVVTP